MTEHEKIKAIISELTLDEKINMLHGTGLFHTGKVERLGIPELVMTDGPMGVRADFHDYSWMPLQKGDDEVSYLPSNSALANTWNTELSHEVGKVLGEEVRGRGKDVSLAPGINIKRNPLCGRNFEYFSEDPVLTAEMAKPLIEGIQESDVASCVKHYALNSQETERLWVNVDVSERALREIYLYAFMKVCGLDESSNDIKSDLDKSLSDIKTISETSKDRISLEENLDLMGNNKAYSIMSSYNLFRGRHVSENRCLLNRVLRDEWNYDGTVISDWGAVHHTVPAGKSSLDIEMSVTNDFDNYCFANPLKEAVKNGKVSEEDIDKKIYHILLLMLRIKKIKLIETEDDEEKFSVKKNNRQEDTSRVITIKNNDEKKDISSIIAVKNNGGKKDNIKVFAVPNDDRKNGAVNTSKHAETCLKAAEESIVLLKNANRILPLSKDNTKNILIIGDNAVRKQSHGGGSAEIKALYEKTPMMGISALLGGNCHIDFAKGYYIPKENKDEEEENWQAKSLEDSKDESAKTNSLEDNKDESSNAKSFKDNNKENALDDGGSISDSINAEVKRKSFAEEKEKELFDEAVSKAKDNKYDSVIFIGGLNHDYDLEGQDRESMALPYHQDELIDALLNVRPDMVTVMFAGSPVSMPWVDKANALILMSYSGMEGGTALAETLFGDINPSGKLAETFPLDFEHTGVAQFGEFPGRMLKDNEKWGISAGKPDEDEPADETKMDAHLTEAYKDDVFVGYRYYDKFNEKTLFPFGYGLSYTEFSYYDLEYYENEKGRFADVTVRNDGTFAGKEIVEIYLINNNPKEKDIVKELVGFGKVTLNIGEARRISIRLDNGKFKTWSEEKNTFEEKKGSFSIAAAKNAEDIVLEQDI